MRNFIFPAENFDSCAKMRRRLPKFKMAAEAQMFSAKKRLLSLMYENRG